MFEIYISIEEFLTTLILGLILGYFLKLLFGQNSLVKLKISIWEAVIFILSVYVIIEVFVSFTFQDILNPELIKNILLIDNFICGIFIYDFFNGLYRSKNKLTYFEIHWIDLIGSIPYIGPLRCCRLFRVLRLLRAVRSIRYILTILFRYKKGIDILNYTLFASILIVLVSTFSVWILEEGNLSFSQSFWWSLFTAFGIGLENVTPQTNEGLAFGFLLTFCGILLVAAFTATLVEYLVKNDEINKKLDEKMLVINQMQKQLSIKEERISEMQKNMNYRDKKLLLMEKKIDNLLNLIKEAK